jgi:hypothetical protein
MAAPALGLPNGQASSGHAGATQTSPNQAGAARGGRGRGANWGLTGASSRSTAVTRPIHVAVLADRVILVPEKGVDRLPQHLMVSPQMTSAEADRFVAAVQREMQSWGLAVANGYWKPVLQIEVSADAEHQFQTLVQALDGSGFEIERK